MSVSVGELIALFAGVEHEDGDWITGPCYTAALARAIAQEIRPTSDIMLRKAIYGERPVDELDQTARLAIEAGWRLYRGLPVV